MTSTHGSLLRRGTRIPHQLSLPRNFRRQILSQLRRRTRPDMCKPGAENEIAKLGKNVDNALYFRHLATGSAHTRKAA